MYSKHLGQNIALLDSRELYLLNFVTGLLYKIAPVIAAGRDRKPSATLPSMSAVLNPRRKPFRIARVHYLDGAATRHVHNTVRELGPQEHKCRENKDREHNVEEKE
jgi:hypothetical protein